MCGGGGGYGPFKNITHISNRSFIKGGRKQKNTGKRAHNLVPVSCALSLSYLSQAHLLLISTNDKNRMCRLK